MKVARETHTIAELQQIVEDAKAELAAAPHVGSREHTEAVNVLAFYQRRLDAARSEQEQQEKDAALSPSEIVDRLMR